MPKPRKLRELSLEKKIQLIKYVKAGASERKTAEYFGVSKGTVNNIKKRANDYLRQFEEEKLPGNRYRKIRKTDNDEVNLLTWNWFEKVREMNVPVSGPMIQEAAKNFAQKLNRTKFVASNGWLECFRKRHQIVFKTICGEAASADQKSAMDFKARLKDICFGYTQNDIFNADETALSFRALPNKSMIEKYRSSSGKKCNKEKFTILLAANTLGEKLQPVVVGRGIKLRCFKNIDPNNLPVIWRAQPKSWMTATLFQEWLININKDFRAQNRKILLFVDNCPSHPNIQLSNIKLEFLPANTTALIQPLDQGVIRTFKCYYRKYLVNHLISAIDTKDDTPPKTPEISILDAVYWIAKAWKDITETCIQNCFRKAGFNEPLTDEKAQSNQSLPDAYSLFSDACHLNIFGDGVSPEEYVTFDEAYKVHAETKEEKSINANLKEKEKVKVKEKAKVKNESIKSISTNITIQSKKELKDEDTEIKDIHLPSYQEVNKMLNQLKKFASSFEPDLLPDISNATIKFADIQVKRKVKNMEKNPDQI